MRETALQILRDARRARKQGGAAVTQRQRARLADIVTFARAHSPYYESLYRNVPARVDEAIQLPVTNKKALTTHFNDWATDRAVTLEDARALVQDPARIGERFLGKYLVVTTSGTTGTPGIFVVEARSLAITNAMALRMLSDWLTPRDVLRILVGRGRMAMVMATGGHYASAVAAAGLRRRLGRGLLALSAHMPMPELVAQLNRFQPILLAPYAGTAALLATEQEAGRLHINPVLLALSAEGLPLGEYDRIAKAFNAKVGNSYAATECMFFSYGCEQKWLHVNADWVVFEPVEVDYSPTPPGKPSHTVLISNLANRVQPILRYDLGDSILQRADPCPCGNPLPAIRVHGRVANTLTFSTASGGSVTIPSLAFAADVPGVEQFQVVQDAPTILRVRLRVAPDADRDRVWHAVQSQLTRLLEEHDLGHVRVERTEEAPEQSKGGKYREVVPLSRNGASSDAPGGD